MKKNRLLLLILAPLTTYAEVHIDAATLVSEHGTQIYGNGQMQAKLRLNYRLRPGVKLESIALKEYETGQALEKVGWQVSETDNGFDHSFSHQKHHQHKSVQTQNQHLYRYVSTNKKNQYINICFEITTSKDSTSQTYTSCYDPGIYQGFVTLHAHRPPKYYNSDFLFSKKIHMFKEFSGNFSEKDKIDIYGQVYSLYPTYNIPRNVRFRLKNKDKLLTQNNFETDQAREIAYQYLHESKPSTEEGSGDETLYIGYKSIYFYEMKGRNGKLVDSLYFSYYDLGQNQKRSKQVKAYSDNEIVNILEVSFYKNSFMWKDYRCREKEGDTTKYQCNSFKDSTTDKSITKNKSEIQKVNHQFAEIELVDNYGNHHTIYWTAFES